MCFRHRLVRAGCRFSFSSIVENKANVFNAQKALPSENGIPRLVIKRWRLFVPPTQFLSPLSSLSQLDPVRLIRPDVARAAGTDPDGLATLDGSLDFVRDKENDPAVSPLEGDGV